MGANVSAPVKASSEAYGNVNEGAVQFNVDIPHRAVTGDARVERGAVTASATANANIEVDGTVESNAVNATVERGAIATNITLQIGDSSLVLVAIGMISFACLFNAHFTKLLTICALLVASHGFYQGQPWTKKLMRHMFRDSSRSSIEQESEFDTSSSHEQIMPTMLPNVKNLLDAKLNDPQASLEPGDQLKLVTGCIEYAESIARMNQSSSADCNRAMIIMGDTGAGKTTFLNVLHGCTMAQKDTVRTLSRDAIVVCPNSKIKEIATIGHGTRSATFFPGTSSLHDKVNQNKYILVDTPGFHDTRGAEINISNTVNTLAVTSKMPSATVIVLVEYNSFSTQRGAAFKALVSNLKKLFPNEIEKYSKFIHLCVTRASNEEAENLEELQKYVCNFDQTGPDRKLLQQLAKNIFFYDPLQQKQTDNIWGRSKILEYVSKAPVMLDTSAFRPYLSDSDLRTLDILIKEQKNIILSHIEKEKWDTASKLFQTLSKFRLLNHKDADKIIDEVEDAICDFQIDEVGKAIEICAKTTQDQNLEVADKIVSKVRKSIDILGEIGISCKRIDKVHKKLTNCKEKIETKRREELVPGAPSWTDSGVEDVTDVCVCLKWAEPQSYTPISCYHISLNGTVLQDHISVASRNLQNLKPGQDYEVKVRANNKAGEGLWSELKLFTTTTTLPGKVQNLRVGARQDDSLTVSWSRPSKSQSETKLQSYKVHLNGNIVYDDYTPTGNPQLKISPLYPGKKYLICVQATNLAGDGSACELSTGTTSKVLDQLKTVKMNLGKLQDKPNKEEEVYHKWYDRCDTNDLSFNLTHISDKYKCNYKISKVEGPDRCNTFKWNEVHGGGCEWKGNSQIMGGKIVGHVKVYAKRSEIHHEEVKKVEKSLNDLEKKLNEMKNNNLYN